MRDKTKALVAALGLLMALTACGGDDSSSAAPDAAEVSLGSDLDGDSARESGVPEEQIDEAFVDLIQENTTYYANSTPEQILTVAHALCDYVESGASFIEVAGVSMGMGLSAEDTGYMTGSSVTFYCPEYKAILEAP